MALKDDSICFSAKMSTENGAGGGFHALGWSSKARAAGVFIFRGIGGNRGGTSANFW